MDKRIRRQLTLFVDKIEAAEIEKIRKTFNPEQYRLIKSHITLCREDEIENIALVLKNLEQLDSFQINFNVGKVIRFDNGKGVLLPVSDIKDQYHLLRSKILKGSSETIRRPEPHITLMHPRNATCTDQIFSVIQKISLPEFLIFDTVSLIEQINGGTWQILQTYKLSKQ